MDVIALSANDTTAFSKFPWHIYAGDPQWVPPVLVERKAFLNPRKNPFFCHAQVQLFLARRRGKPLGRIAAVINQAHDDYYHERAGFFGLFECVNDAEVAAALLEEATAWVRERGATFLRGPVNFSTNELDCGLLIEGFDSPPVFQSSYNPPYYASLIEACGFAKCKDLLAFMRQADQPPSERLEQVAKRVRARGKVTVRPINMRKFRDEVLLITDIYNDAWSANWGFVPTTEAEARHMATALRLAVVRDLILLAEFNGEPVGCFVALPNLNPALRCLNGRLTPWGLARFFYHRRRIDTVRVAMMGVRKRYRRLGIDVLFYTEILPRVLKRGFMYGELAWILEDNSLMIHALEDIEAYAYKRYRLYQKDV
jgi:GNAT superfamily N-acetyltransferase